MERFIFKFSSKIDNDEYLSRGFCDCIHNGNKTTYRFKESVGNAPVYTSISEENGVVSVERTGETSKTGENRNLYVFKSGEFTDGFLSGVYGQIDFRIFTKELKISEENGEKKIKAVYSVYFQKEPTDAFFEFSFKGETK